MKFMLSFTITPDKAKRDEAIQRFLKTGGTTPAGRHAPGAVGRRRTSATDLIYWKAMM
jgi:hypothetical protein